MAIWYDRKITNCGEWGEGSFGNYRRVVGSWKVLTITKEAKGLSAYSGSVQVHLSSMKQVATFTTNNTTNYKNGSKTETQETNIDVLTTYFTVTTV